MAICFQRRGRYMAGFSYLLNPKAVEEGCLAIILPNMVDIPKSNCMLNLFEAHIKSDTVVFGYTSTEEKTEFFQIPANWVQREIFRAVHIETKATQHS